MRAAGIDDPNDVAAVRRLGVIDLPTIQKKANLHFALTLDLFGSEISTNAANAFHAGIKGRFREVRLDDDHRLEHSTYPVLRPEGGRLQMVDEPALAALNARLRDDYIRDCEKGVARWNKIIEKSSVAFELRLPHVAFHRNVGAFRDLHVDPDGNLMDAASFEARREQWLPSAADRGFIESLMRPVTAPGAFAPWIAPPRSGSTTGPATSSTSAWPTSGAAQLRRSNRRARVGRKRFLHCMVSMLSAMPSLIAMDDDDHAPTLGAEPCPDPCQRHRGVRAARDRSARRRRIVPAAPDLRRASGHRAAPGAAGWWRHEGEAFVRINRDGLRDRDHALTKPAGTFRIAVLGDSYAEARSVALESTFGRCSSGRPTAAPCPAARRSRSSTSA